MSDSDMEVLTRFEEESRNLCDMDPCLLCLFVTGANEGCKCGKRIEEEGEAKSLAPIL